MGGLSSGLEALQGMSSAGAAAAPASEAAAASTSVPPSAGTTPALSGFPVPNELSWLARATRDATPPSASTMLGLSERLMKQMQAPAAAPSGLGLAPTAPVSLPPAPPPNVPLSLQQMLSASMARRLGNSGSGPPGNPTGNPFDPRNPFF